MDTWTWQDWLTVVSLVVGIAGLIITIATLKKAGSIAKAVQESNEKQLNKVKFVHRRESAIKSLRAINKRLIGDTSARRSSGEIQRIFVSAQEIIIELSHCCNHFKDEHKNVIMSCKDYLDSSLHGETILGSDDCNNLRGMIVQIISILSQEDYYV